MTALGSAPAEAEAEAEVEVEATPAAPGPYAHLDALLARFATLDDADPRRRALREELVAGFLPVVAHIARRYRDRGEPTADLEQVGAIGLLKALERFDPTLGINFLGYAVPTITGEIQRHFRDRTWSVRVPRRLKDLQGPVREAVAELSGPLGRAPRPSEIAARLGVPVGEVVDALGAHQAHTADSLDVPGRADASPAHSLGQSERALQTVDNRDALRTALDQLPARERHIVALRFFDDLTQTQIAARVGVSQMHVSRLLAQSLSIMRRHLEPRTD